ncbi:hypothetical protein A2U01_0117112, partial [Trifolium medium]|nr:hypothetical protein [Trifolium medium]
ATKKWIAEENEANSRSRVSRWKLRREVCLTCHRGCNDARESVDEGCDDTVRRTTNNNQNQSAQQSG